MYPLVELQMGYSQMDQTNACVEQMNVLGITASAFRKKVDVQKGHFARKQMGKLQIVAMAVCAVQQTVKGTTCIA
jgi:hypothetical protein